ncbi:histidine kinase [Paenibacillus filicis]|uniref:histidine kinase n=1 Tax=Paenibacillus gyeongsangnamensis TaxID=3388067 RepID=A0ABT4Q3A3_9BACL|nr:histidine kinase [Paenibacillus filicis]MCZ8511353.1 histidine kinase [Paenibacillus filicis]
MKKRTLSGQLYRYFLIVIIISLATVGVFTYIQSSHALDKQVEQYLDQMIDSAAYQTDIYLQSYELLSNSISFNSDVRSFLEIRPEDTYGYYYYSDSIKKLAHYSVTSMLNIYKQLNLIYVIGPQGRSVVYDYHNITALDPSLVNKHFNYLMGATPQETELKPVILDLSIQQENQGQVLTMARKVKGISYGDTVGIVAIEFRLQELAKIWDRVNLGKGGFFFIIDDEGNQIYLPQGLPTDDTAEKQLTERVLSNDPKAFTLKYNGEDRMFVSRKSDYSKWHLVASMPLSELRQPVSTIRTTTIMVGLITLLAALWLASRFGRSILAPIRELKDSMRETEKGNWQHIDEIGRTDEIGGLIHSYNLMVTRLSQMIEKVYEAELQQQRNALELGRSELERQQAEFQSLQLQINPHFLYNTLETINCYAIVQDSHEITEMVEAMAFMLRYSIQTNLEEITVANELNHVRNYMIILQHRIERVFEIDVVIPPSLLLEKMVRLTLQPIIENIFQHAFPEGIEAHHYIRIDANKGNGLFQVTVEDNGAGIKPERLMELRRRLELNRLADDSGSGGQHRGGIGLMNVHRRIQMVFGEQYGLSLESEWGQGCRITMTMPETQRPPLRKPSNALALAQ